MVVVDPRSGAGIGSWDIRAVRHALAAVMRRRPEAYHAQLHGGGRPAAARLAGLASEPDPYDSATSIHSVVRAREPGLAARLRYDAYERRLGLVHSFRPGTLPDAFEEARAEELSDSHTGPYSVDELGPDRILLHRDASFGATADAIRIEKRFTFAGDRRSPAIRLEVRVENHGTAGIAADVAIEWPLMLLGGGANPAAWYDVDGRRSPHDGRASHANSTMLTSGNDQVGISIRTSIEPPATAWWSPIETISNSEGGFERTYQGSALVAVWPIRLAPGELVAVSVDQQVEVDRDWADAGGLAPSPIASQCR